MSELAASREFGRATTQIAEGASGSDDVLRRDVYCILGLPIDVIELPVALRRIAAVAANATPFFISTVNVNFLAISQTNAEFRESILVSDLCPADGMPILWIARLLGVPINHRVAGSDMFEALKTVPSSGRYPLRVFLFGGADGLAAAAAEALNERPSGLQCVGSIYPGFGSVGDMSADAIIDRINASGADFLVVSLGAKKGQLWLLRNHRRLRVPVRAHLGAVINFTTGAVKRAPNILSRLGLEWLWRIKEEPHLWRRYFRDGSVLIRLLFTRILLLAAMTRWYRVAGRRRSLTIEHSFEEDTAILRFSGIATERHHVAATSRFRTVIATNKRIVIELSQVDFIDCRFFGLLLMLRKHLETTKQGLTFTGISPRLARLFRLNGVSFLLSQSQGV
jgi:N-acetylglucosaminyldiphosphoundecaprenol N-acetyl-beta-D-mannosaminyltransferase